MWAPLPANICFIRYLNSTAALLADRPIDPLSLIHTTDPFTIELARVQKFNATVYIPSPPSRVLSFRPRSKFRTCPIDEANEYTVTHPQHAHDDEFKSEALLLLKTAKSVLDELRIPFWIGSGTLLGWYRQCDFIPGSKDVDFGVFIKNFRSSIVPAFAAKGMRLTHRFGNNADSFELSFKLNNIKLDLFFFYEDPVTKDYWNGGTQARTG